MLGGGRSPTSLATLDPHRSAKAVKLHLEAQLEAPTKNKAQRRRDRQNIVHLLGSSCNRALVGAKKVLAMLLAPAYKPGAACSEHSNT